MQVSEPGEATIYEIQENSLIYAEVQKNIHNVRRYRTNSSSPPL